MVESLYRRIHKVPKPGLIIADEAHLAHFTKIFDYWADVPVIGATATPISANKDKPLKNYFTGFVEPVTITDLIELGYLAKSKTFVTTDFINSDFKKVRGEYSEESQYKFFSQKRTVLNALDLWRGKAGNKKTLVFCANIKAAQELTFDFVDFGINARCLTSLNTPSQRKEILSDFKEGNFQVLVNCGILTTGYDEPSIECILLMRKTASKPLFFQMTGRGSRVTETKKEFIIIDIGGNFQDFETWDTPQDWKEEFLFPKKKREGIAPSKECPKCGQLCAAQLSVCECGFVFTKKKKKEEEVHTELEELKVNYKNGALQMPNFSGDLQTAIHYLEGVKLKKGYKAGWLWRQIYMNFGEDGLRHYQQKQGFKDGWLYNTIKRFQL